MKITYDNEADALYMKLTENAIVETEEIADGIIVDYDESNNAVGVEIIYFVAKHKKEILPILKKIEQAICEMEELVEV